MLSTLALLLMFGVIPTQVKLVTTDVYFGDRGPYRFVVDTGSQSTLIEPALAEELRLTPAFRVEMVSLHGGHFAPGAYVDTLRAGGQAVPRVEVLFEPVGEARRLDPKVRGVLGANALLGSDYLLSMTDRRLSLDAARPAGEAVPFDYVDGRMVVKGRMAQESLTFVLDSGASHMVLFRMPAAMAKRGSVASVVSTLDGARSTAATTWSAELVLTERLRLGTLPAAVVPREGVNVDGLLPASAFQKIFVDQTRREVVLVR